MTQSDMTVFGHYTTAREVVQNLDLTAKVALVTGGNAGEAITNKHEGPATSGVNLAVKAHSQISNLIWAATSQLMLLQALAQRQWMLWHVQGVMCCLPQGLSTLMGGSAQGQVSYSITCW